MRVKTDNMRSTPFEAFLNESEIATLSDTIRCVVSEVVGGLRLIGMGSVHNELQNQITDVHLASESMACVIEDALNVLTCQSAKKRRPFAPLNLKRFLRDVERIWTERAHVNQMQYTQIVSATIPDYIWVDGSLLYQVLSRPLKNTLQTSKMGNVVLQVSNDAEGALDFIIEDTGPLRLYSPGGRPDVTPAPDIGAGLYLSKQDALRLGARFTLENQRSGGLRVQVTLPQEVKISESLDDIQSHFGVTNTLSGLKVLVVDDLVTNLLDLSQQLDLLGIDCAFAFDGASALHKLLQEEYDLALIDMEMPGLSGFDVMRTESARQTRNLGKPVGLLAVTSYAHSKNRKAIIRAGADGILARPVASPLRLERILQETLDQMQTRQTHINTDQTQHKSADNKDTIAYLLDMFGPAELSELGKDVVRDLEKISRELKVALEIKNIRRVEIQTNLCVSICMALEAGSTLETAHALKTALLEKQSAEISKQGEALLHQIALLSQNISAFIFINAA